MSNHSYCSNNHIEVKFHPLLSKFRGQVTELLRIYEVPASNLNFYFADQATLRFYQYPQVKLWEMVSQTYHDDNFLYNYSIYCSLYHLFGTGIS